MRSNRLVVFTGNSNRKLGSDVARLLGAPLGHARVGRFDDGEVDVEILQNVRGHDVFIIQSTQPPAEHMVELQDLIDAARSARRITAVVPHLGCSRGDRQTKPRQPIPVVRALRNLMGAGPHQVVFLDLHAGQIGSIARGIDKNVHIDYLYARSAIMQFLIETFTPSELERTTLFSIDAGGAKWVESYIDHLADEDCHVGFGVGSKTRRKNDHVRRIRLLGKVRGQVVTFIDDIVSTAKSLAEASQQAIRGGATDVRAVIIHGGGIANLDACKRIVDSPVSQLVITDTVPIKPEFSEILGSKLKVVSIAPLLALAIKAIHEERSVSALFNYPQYRRAIKRLHD